MLIYTCRSLSFFPLFFWFLSWEEAYLQAYEHGVEDLDFLRICKITLGIHYNNNFITI